MSNVYIRRNPILESIFNKVAPIYGNSGPEYFKYFGELLVNYSKISKGDFVLDVASGRGASLFPAAVKAGSSGKVVGVDFSEGMVKETQTAIDNLNIKNTQIIQMDAEALNFEDEYYNAVLCGLAIHFFTDYKLALREFFRVLKYDGTVGISVWKNKEAKDWTIGKVFEVVLPKYFPQEILKNKSNISTLRPEFGEPTVLNDILKDSGFRNICIYIEQKKFYYKDREEWWQEQWSHAGRTTFEIIKMRGNGILDKFKNEVFEELKNFIEPEGIPFECEVLIATGKK